uniref:Uncharacterized protein n=1 Tax=Tetraselmis sp. GSL018 TaxID=582737 RepID=A0A061S5L7_9CHLO
MLILAAKTVSYPAACQYRRYPTEACVPENSLLGLPVTVVNCGKRLRDKRVQQYSPNYENAVLYNPGREGD